MTPVIEKRAKELAVPSDTELQRPKVPPRGEDFARPADVPCGRDGGPDGAEITVTAYLYGDFRERPGGIAALRGTWSGLFPADFDVDEALAGIRAWRDDAEEPGE